MLVSLIKKDKIHTLNLPNRVKGQYYLSDSDEDGKTRELMTIEGVEGKWIIISNNFCHIVDQSNMKVTDCELKLANFIRIRIVNEERHSLVYVENSMFSKKGFVKYVVDENVEVTIGRSDESHISLNNKYISNQHAKLENQGNQWLISDLDSLNGTYHNNDRVIKESIGFPGDSIYLMGYNIILGKGFLSVVEESEEIHYNKKILRKYDSQKVSPSETIQKEKRIEYFFRSPRFKRNIVSEKIKIDSPPQAPKTDQVPLALMLGPSLTMGITALATGLLAFSNVLQNNGQIRTALPTLMMSFSMLLGTVLWPILTKKHEKKLKIAAEKKRQEKYMAYLEDVKELIIKECNNQSEILFENCIQVEECFRRVIDLDRRLWERVISHDDFTLLRLGIGDLPQFNEIDYPEKRFTLDEDNLQDALYVLADEPKVLKNVPITFSLVEEIVCGIIGKRSLVIEFFKGLVVQMTALHSYDELKLVFIGNVKEQKDWEFIRWIPHCWSDNRDTRFYAIGEDDVRALDAFLIKTLRSRMEKNEYDYRENPPYYLIICTNKDVASKSEFVKMLLKHKKNIGVSMVTLYDELKHLPKECSMVIDLDTVNSKIFDRNDISGKSIVFKPEFIQNSCIDTFAYTIANIKLDQSSDNFTLPDMITFLEMYKVGKVEQLNPLARWKENDPTTSLQAAVGVDTNGNLFNIDLHEKYHGPHGLVAGMTGSGKSEFIITYILSMAVNYHPDEVAFILIDYKGGGLAGAFEDSEKNIKLPHLAGTITNLDGAAVTRSLISIQSELRRRQAVFNEARKVSSEGTMDIYKYQKLYRDQIVNQAIPHLFIISDEFAELKSQQPEFMEQLISAARIGRSLGVHLILATQKPSGVVDDQIWSNSRFRVCLKVQERADSMDMIKRPDAAELSTTGRFYLQVGFNELFSLGQSAWCGSTYLPSEKFEKQKDNSIKIIDNIGRNIKTIKPVKNSEVLKNKTKEIVEIVKYLSDLAIEENIQVKPLWLNPIPEVIRRDDLKLKYNYQGLPNILNPIIGELDDPFNQSQRLLTLELSEKGNTIVYAAAGGGKQTFLNTMIYSLLMEHTTEELNLYILDFGAEMLKCFSKAPQVGDVLFSSDFEKINNLFKMLHKEIKRRKYVLSENGGDFKSYAKAYGDSMPSIVVVINNFSSFTENYENLEEPMNLLARDGLKYGIIFVLMASTSNAVRYRTQQHFSQIIILQMNDKGDYSGLLGNTGGVYPARAKGRGLINLDKVYEFQTATVDYVGNVYSTIEQCVNRSQNNNKNIAQRIPILPQSVNVEFVSEYIKDLKSVPIGVNKNTLEVMKMNFANKYINLVMTQDLSSTIGFTKELIRVFAKIKSINISIIDGSYSFEDDKVGNVNYFTGPYDSFVANLFSEIVFRNNKVKEQKAQGLVPDSFHQEIVVIHDYEKFITQMTPDSKDKMEVLLQKGEAQYNYTFILINEASYFGTISFLPWYKEHITGNEGIWLGEGVANQYQLKITKVTTDLYNEIGIDFGYIITNGKPQLLKMLSTSDNESE